MKYEMSQLRTHTGRQHSLEDSWPHSRVKVLWMTRPTSSPCIISRITRCTLLHT